MSRVSKSRTPRTKVYPGFSGSNPFDSDSDSELRPRPPKASFTPVMSSENGGSGASSFYSFTASRNRYKNEFRDSGGLQSQSVQELEGYAVYKAEETTQTVHGALKIAEEIRENAARTLVNLHQQGEQIERTHLSAANIEQDLSRGEKLLGSLGGLFSKTWKPKKTRKIRGPVLIRDESYMRSSNHTEQREKLGISSAPTKSRTKPGQSLPEPTSALEKVQEKNEDEEMKGVLGCYLVGRNWRRKMKGVLLAGIGGETKGLLTVLLNCWSELRNGGGHKMKTLERKKEKTFGIMGCLPHWIAFENYEGEDSYNLFLLRLLGCLPHWNYELKLMSIK